MASALHTALLCPLCRARGRAVLLEAELERDGHLLVVVDLWGCRHAHSFGDPVLLTFEDEWRLIETALDAFPAAMTIRARGRAARGSSRA